MGQGLARRGRLLRCRHQWRQGSTCRGGGRSAGTERRREAVNRHGAASGTSTAGAVAGPSTVRPGRSSGLRYEPQAGRVTHGERPVRDAGDLLRRARRLADLSQRELATRAGRAASGSGAHRVRRDDRPEAGHRPHPRRRRRLPPRAATGGAPGGGRRRPRRTARRPPIAPADASRRTSTCGPSTGSGRGGATGRSSAPGSRRSGTRPRGSGRRARSTWPGGAGMPGAVPIGSPMATLVPTTEQLRRGDGR